MRGLLGERYDVEEAADWRGALDALTETGAFDVAVVELDSRDRPAGELERAVDAAADSNRFVDPAANGKRSPLTRRQREVLQLLADGVSTDGVAHRLGLSAETVRTHTKATIRRLEARDRAHAVAIALRSGLID